MLPNSVLVILKKNIPIFQWSRDYNLDTAISDLVAGITVGLTIIPQSIAYASLAGLDPQYGLYSSLCGGITYVVFGTIPEINTGPTALLSLLTFSYTHSVTYGNVPAAVLLCFLSGIIELLCGILHLGFLVDFVSIPVVAAFTSAGAITIATSQVKNLLGLKFSAESFIEVWKNVFLHIGETRKWDAILGVICCGVLLSMRKLKDFGAPPLENEGKTEEKSGHFKKFLWFSSVARNALVVMVCALTTYFFGTYELKPFSLTSEVPAGWPNVSLPSFKVETQNHTFNFIEMTKELGSGIFVLPFIAIVGNVAIAKAFAHGKVVDASQEMIAVGMCNIFGSFFASYPVNASFSRAAVSSASGVKTPLSGIYTGAMVILAFTFLTPYFSFIPKATLSAVIICAVLFMVEVTVTKIIWKINRIDLIPFMVTLLSCLFLGIELRILIGICMDILILLYSSARPKLIIEKIKQENAKEYLKVTPTSSISFPSAEYLREKIIHHSQGKNGQNIVINCQRVTNLDFTAAKCISAMVSDLQRNNNTVIFLAPTKHVAKAIEDSCGKGAKIYETEAEMETDLKEKHDYTSINFENGSCIQQKVDVTSL